MLMNGVAVVMVVPAVGGKFVLLMFPVAVTVVVCGDMFESACLTHEPAMQSKRLPAEHHQREKRGESGVTEGGHGGECKGANGKNQSRRSLNKLSPYGNRRQL